MTFSLTNPGGGAGSAAIGAFRPARMEFVNDFHHQGTTIPAPRPFAEMFVNARAGQRPAVGDRRLDRGFDRAVVDHGAGTDDHVGLAASSQKNPPDRDAQTAPGKAADVLRREKRVSFGIERILGGRATGDLEFRLPCYAINPRESIRKSEGKNRDVRGGAGLRRSAAPRSLLRPMKKAPEKPLRGLEVRRRFASEIACPQRGPLSGNSDPRSRISPARWPCRAARCSC